MTRDFILNQKPDGIINIVDATNIERNLYLTLQLLEMQIPMVLALNMMDEVRGNGGTIDVQKMSDELGIPGRSHRCGEERGHRGAGRQCRACCTHAHAAEARGFL